MPAYLLVSEYLDELRAQTRKYDCNHILSAVSALPEDSEKLKEIQGRSTYIRQLEFIGLDYTDLFEAASDFLRSRTEKIEWANRGLITQDSIDGFPLPMGKLTSLQGLQEPENPPSFQLLTTACVPINARFQLMLFAIPVSGLVFCSI